MARTTILILGVLELGVLFLGGCGDDKKDHGTSGAANVRAAKAGADGSGAAHPDDCQLVGDRLTTNAIAQTPKDIDPEKLRKLEKLGRDTGHMFAVRCVADEWSVEAVKCGLAARDPQLECSHLLTATQLEKMQADVQEIWAEGLTGVL